MNKETYDVVIIGGGIIGSIIAYELSQYNLKIRLLEKNPVFADETSRGNSGAIHGGFDPEPHKIEARLYVLWLWYRLDLWFHRYRALLPLRPLEAPGQSGGVIKHDREGLSGFTGTGPLSCHHKHRNTP